MKNINLKNKKFLYLSLILIFIILFLIIFLNKGLKEKALKIFDKKEDSVVDIVSDEEYSIYTGTTTAFFEGKHILNFSFLYKKDLKIKQGTGSESRWFKVYDSNDKNNVTVYFTYEGGRGFNAEDYINDIVKDYENLKILNVKFLDESTSTIKYFSLENKNSEYFVEEIKNEKKDPWLLIVENVDVKDEVSQNISRDIVRSFEVK